MPNEGHYGGKKHYSIGGDVSGISPLNEYRIPAEIAVDTQKILGIVGDGTRCVLYEGVGITTDKTKDDIAKLLGLHTEDILEVPHNRLR